MHRAHRELHLKILIIFTSLHPFDNYLELQRALPRGGFCMCCSWHGQNPTTNTSQYLCVAAVVCRQGVTTSCSQNQRSEVRDAMHTAYSAHFSEIPSSDLTGLGQEWNPKVLDLVIHRLHPGFVLVLVTCRKSVCAVFPMHKYKIRGFTDEQACLCICMCKYIIMQLVLSALKF